MLVRSPSNSNRRRNSDANLLNNLIGHLNDFINDPSYLWKIIDIDRELINRKFAEESQVKNYEDNLLETYRSSLNSIIETIQTYGLTKYSELNNLCVEYQQLIKNLEAEQSTRDIALQTDLSILLGSSTSSTSGSLSPKEKDLYYKEDQFRAYAPAEKRNLKAAIIFNIDGTLYSSKITERQFFYPEIVWGIAAYAREKNCALHIITARSRAQSDDPARFKQLFPRDEQPRTVNEILQDIGIEVDSVHYTSHCSKIPVLEEIQQRYGLSKNKILMVDHDSLVIEACKKQGYVCITANPENSRYLSDATNFITEQSRSSDDYSARKISPLTLNGRPFFSRNSPLPSQTITPSTDGYVFRNR